MESFNLAGRSRLHPTGWQDDSGCCYQASFVVAYVAATWPEWWKYDEDLDSGCDDDDDDDDDDDHDDDGVGWSKTRWVGTRRHAHLAASRLQKRAASAHMHVSYYSFVAGVGESDESSEPKFTCGSPGSSEL